MGGMPGEWLIDILERRVLDAPVTHDAPVNALAARHDDLFELVPARQGGFALLLAPGSFDEHLAERPLVASPFAVVILPDGKQKNIAAQNAQHREGDHPTEGRLGIVVI